MRFVLTSLLLTAFASGADRKVVITFDDLPRGGDGGSIELAAIRQMTQKLMQPFAARKVPFVGFVNAGRASEIGRDGLRDILNLWLDAGATLGNHTYSHPNINRVPLADYTADVLKGEPLLREVLAARKQQLIYFRHPFLHTGATLETKQGLANFLREHKYIEAPVTFDDADYLFANAYTKPALRDRIRREYVPYMESIVAFFERRSVEVFGREIPQILLLHANQLNADLMPALLDMFRARGYSFVSLEEALRDEAYRTPESYVGTKGLSWLHRWAHTKGMPETSEPDSPAWVPNPYR
jgi:peptidoglycan-N-acetylglucosamine deacetylase